MGRAKLKLHKLDGSNRIGVYSRRKKGLLKKANELSVLCDIDIFLAMLSPGGKPSVYKSENSSFEDMITKIAEVNPEERAKRKMECLETIKKACKKSDHDVNIGEHLSPGDLTTEDIHFLSHSLRVRLSDIEDRLRLWKNLDKIDNIQQLRKLEDSISKSLNEIAKHKYGMGSLIFCAGEDIQPSPVQHGMDLPSNFDAGKEPHPCSSLHCCDSEIMDAYEDLSSFDSSLLNDTGQDFQASSLMQHGMNEWQDLYQCSSIHGGVDVYPVGTDNSSRLPQSHFVNIHDSSKSASGTCDNMMLEDSLNFLYGTDSLYSSIKHGTNSLSTHLNVSLAVYAGGDCENMDGYDDLNVFDSSLKFDEKQEFQSSSPIQYGMNSPVSFDAGQEGNRFSSVQGGDSESNNGYEDLNSFVQGLLEDPCLSFESYTDIACDHEIETFKPGCENCSADKMFLDCQINQEDLEMAFRSTLDLPLVEKMDAQESTFDCLNKGFGLPQLTSIIV
ncbi:agamous-like MADS-box protein AGL66 isoform X2 [Lycium barbarum]|uniref:agamous-like MADS-box protein AGL66 isoform X2 n=1 Tax=Lycium barbarum TaxID=112863 RepID=UPI00293EE9CA|nr:agamous-like MADS-box protein AGL66 isoform X2 [Lycium barbarum]